MTETEGQQHFQPELSVMLSSNHSGDNSKHKDRYETTAATTASTKIDMKPQQQQRSQ